MSARITLRTVAEFQQHEPAMLAVINGAPRGAELFMVDPFRFLKEHGYEVSAALREEMERAAPALTKLPKELYDAIAAGQASHIGDSKVKVTWRIHSLGVRL